jgi:transposase-like protein
MKIPNSVGRVAIAAGAVLVLGGSAVGIAAAQSQPTSTPTGYQKFIDALAQRLGVSSQQLQTDISQARQDAGLPANGGFPGGRPGGPRPGGPVGGGFGLNFQAAANAIGISVQQLRSEVAGKSLAQVAQNHGKSGTDVANALKNDANQQIDGRIDQLVNRTVPQNANLSQPAQPAAQNGAAPNGNGRGPRGAFGFGAGTLQQGLDVAAQAMGISTDQLRAELPGKSLAQVAQSHGKNASDVATALKNAAHQQIGTRIDQLVNQALPQRAPRGNRGADDTEASS